MVSKGKNHVSTATNNQKESVKYRISPPISPGLIWVRKAFLMGLSMGGLIRGGGGVKNNDK